MYIFVFPIAWPMRRNTMVIKANTTAMRMMMSGQSQSKQENSDIIMLESKNDIFDNNDKLLVMVTNI